ncbi:hypothetical protein BKI52_10575 [marine bacterium AO1-C]|nr:hypothetical protein BKI52_10575 [marine bacterium AO1-C]
MKKLVLFFLVLISSYWTYGQSCGTPASTNPRIYSTQANARGASSAVCINVFFHIVRNTDGTDVFAAPNTDDIVRVLNEAFSPHNIIINNAGTAFLDNTNFTNVDSPEESAVLGQTNNRANAINYYIVENLWREEGGTVIGTANSILSNNMVIRHNEVLRSTSPHELGHCLNLLHTHAISRGREAIDGSNCATAGDLVCDTPADPGLGRDNLDLTCTYTGTDGFTPLTDNIMSSTFEICRFNFTPGQGQRMRTAIAEEPLLQPIVSNNCVRIPRLDLLCDNNATTVTLENLGTATTTWTVSNNVQIVGSDNVSITIIGAPNASGDGWLRATLSNGVEFTEEFWIGRPDVSNAKIKDGGTVNQYATYGFSVVGDRHADRFEWVVPFGWQITTYGNNRSATITPTTNGRHTIHVRVFNDCGFEYITTSLCVQGSGYFCRDFIDPDDPCANNNSGLPCLPDDPVPFSIFPNPVSSVLTIKSPSSNPSQSTKSSGALHRVQEEQQKVTYKLFDSKSSVKSAGPVSALTNIDVSCFPKGVYILKIYGKTVQTHQILIK